MPADKLHEQTEDLKENQYKLILSGNLLYEMSHKIRHIVTKLTTTVEMTVREKLIRYLLSQPVDQDGWISMTEKQIDIARFISVSPEALSREFKDMEEEGLIQKRNKKIKIGDREALMLGRRPKS